eukprot:5463110-Amphidinium_carterae.1
MSSIWTTGPYALLKGTRKGREGTKGGRDSGTLEGTNEGRKGFRKGPGKGEKGNSFNLSSPSALTLNASILPVPKAFTVRSYLQTRLTLGAGGEEASEPFALTKKLGGKERGH